MYSIDPYSDGICKDVSRELKKRGQVVKSKEGIVRRSSTNSMGWQVKFPQGTAQVIYSNRIKQWSITNWDTDQ